MTKKLIRSSIIWILLILNYNSFAQEQKTIVFFGNSLTAGLGVQPVQSFPGVIQRKLQEAGYKYRVINAGLSGETSAGGLARVDWILKNNRIDIFVLELGANDGLRGLDIDQTRKNLSGIIDKVRAQAPEAKIVLAGMQVPPNMGKDYSLRFRQIFVELANKHNAILIPFLLEGVGGNPKLNQPDGIHPNVEGHKIMAENVWKELKPLLYGG
jgi:acyl-CoA thioesterase I